MTRFAPRIAVVGAILTLVVAVIGFVVVMILNAFVLDKYDAYGEVPIPGSSSLHLPAGEVTVSFHTVVTGSPTSGFPIPELGLTIEPPVGVPKPKVTESIGGTTTVNSDTRVRIWVVQIAQTGTYDITTDGNVNGYISPRLAFGHDSSYGWLVWVFVGLFVMGLLELAAALVWVGQVRQEGPPPRAPRAAEHRRHHVERPATGHRQLHAHRSGHPHPATPEPGGATGFRRADRRGVRGREAPHPRDLTAAAAPSDRFCTWFRGVSPCRHGRSRERG